MLKKEVQIGATYGAKVSGKVVPVRILEQLKRWRSGKGMVDAGWRAVNEKTGREVYIAGAQRLRFRLVKAGERYKKVPANEVEPAISSQRFDRETQVQGGLSEEERRERQAEYDERNNPPLEMPPM